MSVRDKVIEYAHYWALPGVYRPNADELVEFYRGAGCGQTPKRSDAAIALHDANYDSAKTGVMLNGKASHWCGIFATYILRSAGLTGIRWDFGYGGIPQLPKYTAGDVMPGDIGIVNGVTNHHVIITDSIGPAVWTVEGNTGGENIRESRRWRSEIGSFYRFT